MISAGEAVAYLTMDYSGYSKGLKSAGQELNTFLDSNNSAGVRINALGNSMVSVGKTLTKGVTMPILGVGTAITMMSANFEEGMSEVQAISGATGKDLQMLTDKAKELGSSTKYSASEAAAGMSNLASAGFNVTEIMSAMPGMLDLAASGNIDLASAADIASSTLRGFGLEASEAAHVADVLAKAAADTNAGITDTGEAMKYIAPVAASMGFSLEEVTAAIGEMANAGIRGGQAGTTLRSALTRLANPSKEASDLMKELGFNAYDANDKMLPLKGIVENLDSSLEGLTEKQQQQAIATIFGQEAMSGMLTLIQAGPEQLDKLTNSLKISDGAASKMAKTMQDNLKGQLTTIKSKIEGAAISLGETLIPMLSKAADKIEDAVDWFNNLDEATQENIVKWGALAAAIGPALVVGGKVINGGVALVSTIGKVSSGVGSLISATRGLGSTATVAANGGIAKATVGIAGFSPAGLLAVGAITAVGTALYTAHEYSDLYSDSVLKATDDMSLMEIALGNLTGATMYSKEELVKLCYVYDEWSGEVSENTQAVLDDVSDKSRWIQLAIDTINFDGVISDADIATVADRTGKWCDSIVGAIEGNKSEVNTAIEGLFAVDGIIDESEQALLDVINARNNERVDLVQQCNDEINEITKKAQEEKRSITEDEQSRILDLTIQGNQALLDSMNISYEERQAATNLFFEKSSTYSAKELSKSLVEEKAILDEKKQTIRDSYEDGIRALEAVIPTLTGKEKELAELQLQNSIDKRDLLLQNENDKWSDIVNACEDGYSDYMTKINKYTGEELSKGDIKSQKAFEQTKNQYDGMNQIVEDGMYKLYNKSTQEWDNVVVKTDEATGDIVGMCQIVADEYGLRTGDIVGYSEDFRNAVGKEGYSVVDASYLIMEALKDQTNTTFDWKNNCIKYNGQVIAKFDEVTQSADGTRTGIVDLNGTKVEIKVNKDGTVTDLQDIIDKLLQINSKEITVTTYYTSKSNNRQSQYATGTYSAMSGVALVGENGPELINLGRGGQRIYNNAETERIIGNMQSGEKVTSENFNSNLVTQLTNDLRSITSKLNDVLNSEGTIELTNNMNMNSEVLGRVVTPIISNKLAIASIAKRRR